MEPIHVIAEYGTTCKGMLDVAHVQVDAARAAGCTAYKTQLLTPEYIASADAPAYWHHAPSGLRQRDSFAATGAVPYQAWREIVEHCDEAGLDFVASPFDLYAVEILAKWPTVMFKVASGDLTNVPLLRAIHDATDRPIIVSTGAATENEILRAACELGDARVIWLACTLEYPCPVANAELARVRTLRHLIGQSNWSQNARQFGYSDHVGKPGSAMGAVFMGAEVLEVHCTLTPGDTECPDDAMALDPKHLADYVTAANTAAVMAGSGRLAPLPEEGAARAGAGRSIRFTRSLPAGHRLAEADLICLRPAGVGLSPLRWDEVVGAVLTRAVGADDPVNESAIA